MVIIAYLLLCVLCFTMFSLCTKKVDKQDVSVGVALLFLFLSVVPGLNAVCLLSVLIHMTVETKFLGKKLF